jgi:hypothetical protein
MLTTYQDRSRARRLAAVAVATLATMLALAAPASAEFGFASFEASFHDPAGNPTAQAGAPTDFTTAFSWNTTSAPTGEDIPDGQPRDIFVDTPPGFYGDPQAVPQCTPLQFSRFFEGCAPSTQVGVARLLLMINTPEDEFAWFQTPIYNMVPREHETASLGFRIYTAPVQMTLEPRTDGDYGLRATIRGVNQAVPVFAAEVTLWGVPSDPVHDAKRFNGPFGTGAASGAPRAVFLRAPSRCVGGLDVTMAARSWQEPERMVSATRAFPAMTGCESTGFEPTLTAGPTAQRAGRPSGFDVGMEIPQTQGVQGLATPQLRKAVVRLPEGVAISPGSADGLVGCSDEQLALGSTAAPLCPEASKIGSVEIDTPLLAKSLTGDVVLGTPRPGNLFRLFLVVRGPSFTMKLPGTASPDPATGQITATFAETPQLPFDSMRLRFKGGPRAPLTMPDACGTYATTYELTSWAGQVVTGSDEMVIDEECGPAGFTPGFFAGSVSNDAGAFSPFTTRITRSDRQPDISRIDVDLPQGLLGDIASVERCAEAQAVAGTCAAASRIGKVTVGSGTGDNPFYLGGQVYLTDGYKGAPFGLSIVVPAIAGPFDLGTVIVRARLDVDPRTAAVSVSSDPLPRILEGVPLRIRDVRVDIDRERFMRNPTSCRLLNVGGTISSFAGPVSNVSDRFRVEDCGDLRFSPRLRLALTGKSQTAPGRHPGLRAVMTQPKGQANMKAVKVKLPSSLALDPANAATVCGYEEGLAASCPKTSRVGRASARTPILSRPLTGPVYLVQGIRFDKETGARIRTLPTLLVKLRGEIAIDLRAKNSVSGRSLVTTFRAIPDAPVSKFTLNMSSGANGILAVTGERNLCRASRKAGFAIAGQNRDRTARLLGMKSPCSKG